MSRPSKPKPAPAEAPQTEIQAAAPAAGPVDPASDTPQVAPDTTGAVSPSASAAAEAPAAPVDPQMPSGPGASPDPANSPDGSPPSPNAPTPADAQPTAGAKGHVVRVIGPAKGRWRAGRKFGPEAVEIPVSELTVEDLAKLMGDPELTCLVVGEA